MRRKRTISELEALRDALYKSTVYGQNGDTETATEMAIHVVKTATNSNNTYSSSEAYIIDRRLYTYNMQLLSYMKKVGLQYSIARKAWYVSAEQIWACDI